MKDRKKWTPDYFGWILLFIFDVCLTLFWLWLFYHGFNLEKRFAYDFLGYSISACAAVIFTWNVYEIWILTSFLMVEFGRTVEFDPSEKLLYINHNRIKQTLHLSDLTEVIFSNPRFGTRTPTRHLSYTQLNFRSQKPIVITSFLMNTKEVNKLLGRGGFKKTSTNRNLFEGIKLK